MDIKHLEQVSSDGLELWRPVMKSPLPVSPADARAVLAALAVDAPPLALDAYDFAELAGVDAAVTLVPVHKTRRRYTFGGCMAELTDIGAGGWSARTIAVEAEDPARVTAAVHELRLGSRPNVSVVAALAAPRLTRGG